MSGFLVYPKHLKQEINEEKQMASQLLRLSIRLENVAKSVGAQGGSYHNIEKTIEHLAKTVSTQEKGMNSLQNTLQDAVKLYETTESYICSGRTQTNTPIDVSTIGLEADEVDTEFLQLSEKLEKELNHFPPNLVKIQELLWDMWATDTGNKMEKEIFQSISGLIGRILAFEYVDSDTNPTNGNYADYYHTNEVYGIQRIAGFANVIDKMAPLLGMDLDCETLEFIPEGSDTVYRLEFWKGSYGFGGAYGGEIGLYERPASNAEIKFGQREDSEFTWYQCVDEADEISTKQTIMSDGEVLLVNDTEDYAQNGDHFWNLAIQTDPGYEKEDLQVQETIRVTDAAMRDAIIEAVNNNTSGNLAVEWREESNEIIIIYK